LHRVLRDSSPLSARNLNSLTSSTPTFATLCASIMSANAHATRWVLLTSTSENPSLVMCGSKEQEQLKAFQPIYAPALRVFSPPSSLPPRNAFTEYITMLPTHVTGDPDSIRSLLQKAVQVIMPRKYKLVFACQSHPTGWRVQHVRTDNRSKKSLSGRSGSR